MPDMTNAQAAAVLRTMPHITANEQKAIETALAALTPKTDENGHALCGCGNPAKAEKEYDWYHIRCTACDNNGGYGSLDNVWEEWDISHGLRRDA